MLTGSFLGQFGLWCFGKFGIGNDCTGKWERVDFHVFFNTVLDDKKLWESYGNDFECFICYG